MPSLGRSVLNWVFRNESPLGSTAPAGFILALFVYVATVTGVDVYSRFPSAWLLHLGAILVFCLFALSALKAFPRRHKLAEIIDHFPGWVVFIFAIVFAHVLLNIFVCLPFSGGGNADLANGQYVL